MSISASYSIGQLAAAAGVTRRTLHFYVQRGLLQPPHGRGRGARYADEHLARLLQVKAWQEQGVPLEEIRRRVSGDPEGQRPANPPVMRLEALRDVPAPRAMFERNGIAAPADVPGTAWFRQPLVAGFELHVAAGRRPLTAPQLALLARALGEIVDNGGEEE